MDNQNTTCKKAYIWMFILLGTAVVVGADTFLELEDTPSTYLGSGGYHVTVNETSNTLIFTEIPYGEMYIFNNMTVTTVSQANTYYNVSNGMTEGITQGITYNNTQASLQIETPGIYEVQASFSFSGSNVVYHGAIGIDGARQEKCHMARSIGNANDLGSASMGCLLNLTQGQELTLMLENTQNTANFIVFDANIIAEWKGYT